MIVFLLLAGKSLQNYYKLLKYKSFFAKKLQKSLFFCNFAPSNAQIHPKK